jgi:hypothetical protein
VGGIKAIGGGERMIDEPRYGGLIDWHYIKWFLLILIIYGVMMFLVER